MICSTYNDSFCFFNLDHNKTVRITYNAVMADILISIVNVERNITPSVLPILYCIDPYNIPQKKPGPEALSHWLFPGPLYNF